MKNKIIIFSLISLFFLNIINVSASTNTFPRTESDLQVPSNVSITDKNKPFILNTPKVDASEKVYDFADLFTDIEEQELYNEILSYIKETSMDFAIVTISENPKSYFNGSDSTTVYADDFHDYNNFKTDAVVFLIDMDNRKFYISTSGKAIIMYDDARINSTLDIAEFDMKNKDYAKASKKTIKSLKNYYKEGIPRSNKNCKLVDGKYKCYKKVPLILITLVSLILVIIIWLIIALSYKKIKAKTNAADYVIKKKTNINKRIDLFLTSNTSRVRIESTTSSSRGSSTHSSSSGSSHGGGGRSF